jgi:succinate dehydrogenase/fumarate reductase flavoprotein subunit
MENISGSLIIDGIDIPIVRYNTVVIGSGAAGFNAADSLHGLGVRSVALITEGVGRGTSRNAGSDKQTYYKLSLGGGEPDSVGKMAENL